jgi:type III pantothenate kinase
LASRAAQLFKISFEAPESPIGKSSEEAMRAGFYLGAIGQTDYIIESITKHWEKQPKVVATGGLAPLIAPKSKYISEVLPDITLDGLRLIFELNS